MAEYKTCPECGETLSLDALRDFARTVFCVPTFSTRPHWSTGSRRRLSRSESATSAITNSTGKSPAVEWASCTRRGKSR